MSGRRRPSRRGPVDALGRALSKIRDRTRALLFGRREERYTAEEMRFHLDMEAERLVREEGLDPAEARRRAAVAFGGVQKYREATRDARGLGWMRGLSLDLKLGGRMLVKHPGLTLIGGLGMTVAIAISVGFFAFALAYIYPEIPLPEGDRIVAIENRDAQVNNEDRQALHDFVTWREELRTIEDVGAFRRVSRTLVTGEGPPELVDIAEMTAAGFQLARVPPLLGRYLVPDDERPGASNVVVIGYDAWHDRFAADTDVVGRDLRLGNVVHTIVGVMPEGFAFPENHAYWTPFRADPSDHERRAGPSIYIFGRLAPGVSMEEAQAELTAVGQRAAAAFPETHAQIRPMVMPYVHSLTDVQGITFWEVGQMQAMMSLLVIVIALNVAVLIYARTATRHGEIAVRSALGAGRRRILAQLFLEALVLSAVAAVLGLALAQVGINLGNAIMETEMDVGIPFWMDYGLRPETVLWTVGLAVLAAVIVGVLPGLRVAGGRVQSDLRQLGGATGMRLGGVWTGLIVVQLGIAVAALPAAVNMGWDFLREASLRVNYPVDEMLSAFVSMEADLAAGAEDGAESHVFGIRLEELIRRVRAEPAVAGVGFRARLPDRHGRIRVEGLPAPAESPSGHQVATIGAGEGILELLDARLLAGRFFGPGDFGGESDAVIVNERFVRGILDGGNALGRRIRHVSPEEVGGEPEAGAERWYEIVGIIADLETNSAAPEMIPPGLYYPIAPAQVAQASLAVRVRDATPQSFTPRLRELALAVDPMLRVGRTITFAEANRQEQMAFRLVALAVGLVLLSALLLSGAGIYALTSFAVTQRRGEIGIRSALGASPRRLLASVFARVGIQIGLGLAAGLTVAAVLEVVTDGELLGGRGAVLLPSFAVVMAAVAFLAAVKPGLRGLRIQPAEALRAE